MLPNLSIRQLQTFREIMRCGSVSAAARALGRTQPTVSAMLANLEGELGFELFERDKRRLVAKPEAYFFLERAEEILAMVRKSAVTMREIGDLEQGVLNVASMPGPSHFFLPQLIGEFVKDRPGIKVSIMTRSSVKVHEWIASQHYDVGFAEPPPQSDSLIVEKFAQNCVCALRSDDPLSKNDVITPAHLDGAPLAVLYSEHFSTVRARRIFEDCGADFVPRFEVSVFIAALTFAERGLAYALVDPISAASYSAYCGRNADLTFRRFEPDLRYSYSILTPSRRPLSLTAAAFCERLRETIPTFIARLPGMI
ncbi:LysR family transcriptional regulator [Brucella grignonensis]|uniref:LysR substrate binding domain protein n=2 Tax=Brucella grignonensis TaxID=94627 RepID=A0A256F0Z3_9HYPH|nr:LysR family transcriptional regulator [Brucella grignonensis]OYR08380.1 lysR substrate binding domain protein [Brucella grignonensis]